MARILYGALADGGPHAHGYMRYDGSKVTYYKQPGSVAVRSNMRNVTRLIREGETKWVVGHVRFATHGKPERNVNNHPILHGNILGVHNGVLRNHADILKITGRRDPSAVVDSEAIFSAVNKWGHTPGLRKIIGDMVAIYTDLRKPHLVHIAKTQGRSLAMGWTMNGNLIFASERQALLRLEAHGVKFSGDLTAIREMRHLIVRDGKIIYRHTFGEPEKKPEPVRTSLRDPWWDYHSSRIETGADLRRELFKDSVREEIQDHEHLLNGQMIDHDTYYYHGRLMTADEYVETLADEMDWSDFE
jgi:glutamine phosphoribosylpyrophosphate amidotransferase